MKKIISIFLALSIGLPFSSNAWSLSGFASWASAAVSYAKNTLSGVIKDKPFVAAGACICAATVCVAALFLKKYTRKTAPSNATAEDISMPTMPEIPSEPEHANAAEDSQEIASIDQHAYYTTELREHAVVHQAMNSCGFHSVYNALKLAQMVLHKEDKINTSDNHETISMWQKQLGLSNDLAPEHIFRLIRQYAQNTPMCVMPDVEQMVEHLDSFTQSTQDSLIDKLTQLRTAPSGTPICFIVGDIRNTLDNGQLQQGYGHWIAVVAHADHTKKKIYLEWANSLPKHTMTKTLKQLSDIVAMPAARMELKRKLAPLISSVKPKLEAKSDHMSYEDCLLEDIHPTLMYTIDPTCDYLALELKPLQEVLKTLHETIVPKTKEKIIEQAWEQLVAIAAVKKLITS